MTVSVETTPSPALVAGFFGVDAAKLAARDLVYRPVVRWAAFSGGQPIGVATALVRPDDRLVLNCRLTDEAGFAPLLDAAVACLDRPIHLSVTDAQPERLRTAMAAGFLTELRSSAFRVPFETALAQTSGSKAGRVELLRADQVAADDLFALDIELRQDVPGCQGWRGDRTWFDDEMSDEDFDPRGYVVARDRSRGELIGLCRLWKRPSEPMLGLVGVKRSHRTGHPARMLLHSALAAASTWGSSTFVAHTAHRSLQRRLRSIGGVQTGETRELVNR